MLAVIVSHSLIEEKIMNLFLLEIIFVAQPIKSCPCNVLTQLRVRVCADYLHMRCYHEHSHEQVSTVKFVKGQSNAML